jgi:hypothetical protein
MTIDFDDDYEDFDDDGDLDDDEHHDDVEDHDDDEHHDDVEDLTDEAHHDDTEHHDDDEYVPPAPRRLAKHRSGGLWPCGVPHCDCKAYDGTEGTGYSCACGHLYQIHLHGFG